MMGKVSAIAALCVGALFVGFAALNFRADLAVLAAMTTGVLLLVGGARTLRKMSGGLRLLAGAWGLAAGLLVMPYAQSGSLRNFMTDLGLAAYAFIALSAIAAIGLALTVLHKEK